jgi:hypothetical protein
MSRTSLNEYRNGDGDAMKSKKKLTASDLQRQAEAMIAAGTMPSLEAVLKAVAESRAEYRDGILQARSETLELNDHDRHFLSELGIEVPEDARWPLDDDSADSEAAL